jgi:hypothetical protein
MNKKLKTRYILMAWLISYVASLNVAVTAPGTGLEWFINATFLMLTVLLVYQSVRQLYDWARQ